LDQPTESRHFVKSAEARAKIRESIKAMNPDVIALEEMGTTNALLELRGSLKADDWIFRIGNTSAAWTQTFTSPC
jgi:chemotaxis response regulator CheB